MKTTSPKVAFRRGKIEFPRLDHAFLQFGLLAIGLVSGLTAHAQSTNGTWTSATAGGAWTDTSKWAGGTVAGGAGSTANFSTINPSGVTIGVTVSTANARVGTLLIGDTDNTNAVQITASNGYSLIFDNNGAGALFHNVSSASNTAVSGPILLADSLTIKNDKADSAKFLEFRGTLSAETAGLKTITVTGSSAGRTTFTSASSISDGAGQVAVTQASATSALQLYGTNTYTGGTRITNGGTIAITADSGLGAASGTLTFNNGTLSYAPTAAGATLNRAIVLESGNGTLQSGSNAINVTGNISGVGGLTKTGSAAVTLSGVNTYEGGTTINQGNVLIGSDENLGAATGGVTLNGGNLQFSASVTSARNTVTTSTSAGGFSTNSSASVVWTGDISGAGRINKSGSGEIYLQGNNTYEGGTYITNGVLRANTDANLGAASGLLSLNAATLDMRSSSSSTRNVSLTGNATVGVSFSSTTSTWNGAFSGTGSLTKTYSGNLVLNGTGSYTGGTTVSGGTLTINGDFTSATGNYAVNGGKMIVGSAGQLNAASSISVAAGTTFAYHNNTQALSSTVNLAGAGLASRAILGGNGRIASALTLDDLGDTLAPGSSPGTLTFGTAQTWNSFSYDWEINNFTSTTAGTAFDQILVDGALTLSGTGSYQLNLLSLTSDNIAGGVINFSEGNREWSILTTTGGIINFDSALWTVTTTGFTADGGFQGHFDLNQIGNDLVLSYTAVPEPSTYALIAGGLALGLIAWRRRSRH